jgi:heme A synthase
MTTISLQVIAPRHGFTAFQLLTVTTVVATLILIGVGSIVRTTGSGLGCPDWPLCHGGVLPPLERTAIIEYSHRTVASIVGALIVAQTIWAVRDRRRDGTIAALAAISLPLLALQAWLGKETVERELPAEVVTFHLSMALILFAVLGLIAVFAIQGPTRRRLLTPQRLRFARTAMIAGALVAAVLVVGSYLVGSDAGFACTGWPNCPEAPVPFVDGSRLQHIHWIHRITVLGGLVGVGWLWLAARELPEDARALRLGAFTVVALYGVQIVVGAGNIWSDFSEAIRVLHLVVGSAIWALLIAVAVGGQFEPSDSLVGEPNETARAT